jgi:class 3 adenylate cyclase
VSSQVGDFTNLFDAAGVTQPLSGQSASGKVLVSHTVRDLARTSAGVSFEDRGEQALKGVGEAVRVWAVHRQAHEGREGQGRWTRRPSSTPRPPTV